MLDKLKVLISNVLAKLKEAVANYNALLDENAQLKEQVADLQAKLAEALRLPPAADEAIAAAEQAAMVARQEAASAKAELETLKTDDATEDSQIDELVKLLESEINA